MASENDNCYPCFERLLGLLDTKFSIIIPAFNAEEHIERAVESVLEQTYSNYEVIIVDDGSTDATGERCKRFIDDNKVKYISIIHSGASVARNCGVDAATGDYIVFVDGDDFIENYALSDLNEVISNYSADCIVCPFITDITEPDLNSYVLQSETLNGNILHGAIKQSTLEYISRLYMIFTPWRFVVKTAIIRDGVLFHKGIIHEDEEWCVKVLLKSKTIDVLSKSYYHYVLHAKSVMNSTENLIHVQSLLAVCDALISCLNHEEIKFKRDFLKRCIAKNLNFARFYILNGIKPLRRIRTK